MRYFITGATGFLGGEIARQLRRDGHDVVALVRTPGKAEELASRSRLVTSPTATACASR
jgi:uncharacterized protein YbjT (DUF2867 family)